METKSAFCMDDKDLKNLSDEEILEESLSINPDLFGVLIERYEKAFLRKAISIVKNREEAEELVQDTFTKIYIYGPKCEKVSGAQFSSWAYRILINTCITHYNKKKNRKTINLSEEMVEFLDSEEDSFINKLDAKEKVLFALSKLPETLSGVLRLQFMEGYSQKEIAEIEGLSVEAVKSRVFRAKEQFREVLENQGSK